MTMQDPIADMLTQLRNGQAAGKRCVVLPASKQKSALAEVLKREGYIEDYSSQERDGKLALAVTLKYFEGRPVIEKIERASRPGLRIYRSQDAIPKVSGGLGIAVVSTSQGLMSDREARQRGIGGEVLGYIV
jgi:small subunit ribosomal protein S8